MKPASRFFLAFLLAVLTATLAARAQSLLGLGSSRATSDPVHIRALVDHDPLTPGQTAQLAVEVRVDPRYHIQSSYAQSPYIAAHFTKLSAPSGITLGQIRYPNPTVIPSPPALGTGTLSVYESTVYFVIPFSISPGAPAGDASIHLSIVTQACNDTSCLEPKTVPLDIPITIAPPPPNSANPSVPINAEFFAAANKQTFAPAPPAPDTAASQTAPSALPVAAEAPTAAGPGRTVALLPDDQELALISARPYAVANSQTQQHSVPVIFLFALLGGLILNIMPCVLPVIPLKALSLIQQAHGDRRLAVMHGLVFSAGIVTLFILLAILLRSFGLFYGQQFQSSAFLISMTLLVVALALSMLGVWTINPPEAVYTADARISQATHESANAPFPQSPPSPTAGAHRAHNFSAYAGSFGNGLMATLLATPCSAPFLGGVLAWALVNPTWVTAFALAVVGIGMSLPYLLLAAFPGLLSKFPRAGRWSELLKQGLGILMLGVAGYLLTLITDVRLWPWTLAAAIIVAFACWGWGQIPTPLMDRSRIWTIRGIVLAICIALGAAVWKIAVRAAAATDQPLAPSSQIAFLPDGPSNTWLPFNIALLDQALADGRPVVVDWTANWCLNCHVLEATVLSRDTVHQAFHDRNAVLLRADLSNDNPPASALNRKLGGEAIPVLAIFSPSRPTQPAVLRDSYSPSRLTTELAQAH